MRTIIKQKTIQTLIAAGMLTLLCGCASTAAKTKGVSSSENDPFEGWNRGAQKFNDNVDAYVMKPLAKGYDKVMPEFAHHAVTNFFSNIDDIDVVANAAFQGKFAQSGQDTARFLVNTTAGVGGLIDVGTMLDLPKHLEDFDKTLAKWGVSQGPYLVLPFFGPSSPRGVAGLIGDAAMNPISYTGIYFNSIGTAYAVSGGLGALKAIDTRANNLGLEKVISEAAIDRYEFFKNAYLARRRYLINEGNVPEDQDVLKLYQEDKNNSLSPVSPY